jgi:uncharacterized metal-binding protein YceD (DUF177 family)
MTEPPETEFCRLVAIERLPADEVVYEIAARPEERAALARRLQLLALDRLEARVRLCRLAGGLIRLSATLAADVVQSCVVTLEPVVNRVEEEFTLLYGGEEMGAPSVVLDGEAELIEPLTDAAVDIGETVAQQLSLALDPYPRAAGARPPGADEDAVDSRFAALIKWREKR